MKKSRLLVDRQQLLRKNMIAFEKYANKMFKAGGALREEIINAFVAGALTRWKTRLISRIILKI